MSSVSGINSLLSSATPATTTPSVNISSLLAAAAGATTPGIDVNAAVAAAIYADRATERAWQSQQATLTAQSTALTQMNGAATTLGTDMQALNSLSGPLSARSVTSSNPNDVTATAASGTAVGNHIIVVGNLAATASWYSDEVANPTSALPTESFTITTAAGPSATIALGSGVNTLSALATNINGLGLGVTATVVNDAIGSRLAIVSNSPGGAADFSVTSAPTTTTAWSSPSVPSSTASLSAGGFTLTTGGVPTSITITSGETLTQLAADVNGQGLGVTASVVSDPLGFHLAIASSNGTTPFTMSMPTFGFSQAAVGVNAALTVDGIPISSASNTVTGALPGVTLNLLNQTSGAQVNLVLGTDTRQISNAVQSFVTDYNSAIQLVNAQFSFTPASGGQGVLGGDSTVRDLQDSLLGAMSYTASNGPTSVTSLSDLGISVNHDGTLALDQTALANAVTNSASDVQSFFQGPSLNGFANTLNTQLDNLTNPTTGAFTVDLSSNKNSYQDIATHISDFESIYISRQQASLTAMYSAAEIALQQLPTKMAQIQAELGNSQGK